jgi:hypothetical protein
MMRILGLMGALIVSLTVVASDTESGGATPLTGVTNLVGTFGISAGRCAATGPPTGSYLEIEVEGTPVPNAGSSCNDAAGSFTPLTQGRQGLVTGTYQPDPVPTFDSSGNSEASAIVHPVRFLTNTLGLATTCANQANDPTPTGGCASGSTGFPVPSLEAATPGESGCPLTSSTDCLFGDLSGLGITWAGYPIKAIVSNPLNELQSLLARVSATCANSSGCDSAGVTANPTSGTACVSATDPGGCVLFGTFNPTTGAYALGISTGLDIGLLPHAVLQLVLRGTFTPLPNGALIDGTSAPGQDGQSSGTSASGEPGQGGGSSASSTPTNESSSADGLLEGTLTLGPSSCPNSTPTGSYFIISYAPLTEGNSSSSCDGGSYTLLQPGTTGLAVGAFTPDPSPTFDANGNSLANSIITPVPFSGHSLGLGTSPDDVQDAPQGPAVFSAPEAIVEGTNLAVDLRSLNASYDGTPNDTCAQSYGVGCWLEGSRVATGTYDPTTGDFTLDWFSSQDFSGGSGEVDFHLSGHFTGTVVPANSAQAEQLAGSVYSVTSTAVESETFDAPLGASSAPPVTGSTNSATATPTTIPLRAHSGTHKARMQAAMPSSSNTRTATSSFPLLIVVLGAVAATVLLWVGRRSRKDVVKVSQEHQ